MRDLHKITLCLMTFLYIKILYDSERHTKYFQVSSKLTTPKNTRKGAFWPFYIFKMLCRNLTTNGAFEIIDNSKISFIDSLSTLKGVSVDPVSEEKKAFEFNPTDWLKPSEGFFCAA